MSLKQGKWWGGYYNTIPLDPIKKHIEQSFDAANQATATRNVDDILDAVKTAFDNLGYVVQKIESQELRNKQWKEQFMEYKTRLVAEQTLREERKHNKEITPKNPKPKSEIGHEWKMYGDKYGLFNTDEETIEHE